MARVQRLGFVLPHNRNNPRHARRWFCCGWSEQSRSADQKAGGNHEKRDCRSDEAIPCSGAAGELRCSGERSCLRVDGLGFKRLPFEVTYGATQRCDLWRLSAAIATAPNLDCRRTHGKGLAVASCSDHPLVQRCEGGRALVGKPDQRAHEAFVMHGRKFHRSQSTGNRDQQAAGNRLPRRVVIVEAEKLTKQC
jgi:hypothetical protein